MPLSVFILNCHSNFIFFHGAIHIEQTSYSLQSNLFLTSNLGSGLRIGIKPRYYAKYQNQLETHNKYTVQMSVFIYI